MIQWEHVKYPDGEEDWNGSTADGMMYNIWARNLDGSRALWGGLLFTPCFVGHLDLLMVSPYIMADGSEAPTGGEENWDPSIITLEAAQAACESHWAIHNPLLALAAVGDP